MKTMLTKYYAKPLAVYLAAALLALTTLAGPAEAMFVPSAPHQDTLAPAPVSADRIADLGRIQTALESKIVRQRLMDYGLSPEETLVRVNKLSDEEIGRLAANTDALQAGGDSGVDVLLIILIVLLIILIVQVPVHADGVNA